VGSTILKGFTTVFNNHGYETYIGYKHSHEERTMSQLSNRTRYFLDIEQELKNRFKVAAALQEKTMKQWLKEAIRAKLEDEIDTPCGTAALVDSKGTTYS